eukprot:7137176-Prymnesium_polylepis.1
MQRLQHDGPTRLSGVFTAGAELEHFAPPNIGMGDEAEPMTHSSLATKRAVVEREYARSGKLVQHIELELRHRECVEQRAAEGMADLPVDPAGPASFARFAAAYEQATRAERGGGRQGAARERGGASTASRTPDGARQEGPSGGGAGDRTGANGSSIPMTARAMFTRLQRRIGLAERRAAARVELDLTPPPATL